MGLNYKNKATKPQQPQTKNHQIKPTSEVQVVKEHREERPNCSTCQQCLRKYLQTDPQYSATTQVRKCRLLTKCLDLQYFLCGAKQKRKILHVTPAVYIMKIRFHIHVLFMQKHIQSTVAALVQLNIKTVHSQEYGLWNHINLLRN